MSNDNTKFEPVNKSDPSLCRSPIFPLPIFMLCGGVQRLRIFEQKYIDMVADCQQTDGFVIALPSINDLSLITNWGAHVQIVDFDKGDDGMLMIDVQADYLVEVADVKRETTDLLTASISPLAHWSADYDLRDKKSDYPQRNEDIYDQLSALLKTVFGSNNEFNKLYKSFYFESPQWVCARLLEIVPIPLSEKSKFVEELALSELSQFLGGLCEQENAQTDSPIE